MANLIGAGRTPARVAATATARGVLDRNRLTLIGIMGPASAPRALVRLPGGRIKEVAPGDRLSQGRVLAIDADGLVLQSGGGTRRLTVAGS